MEIHISAKTPASTIFFSTHQLQLSNTPPIHNNSSLVNSFKENLDSNRDKNTYDRMFDLLCNHKWRDQLDLNATLSMILETPDKLPSLTIDIFLDKCLMGCV